MLLHPGVIHHSLIDIAELSEYLRAREDGSAGELNSSVAEQRTYNYGLLHDTFKSKLKEDRTEALVLLPLYSGLEISWSGQDLLSTALPGVVASLFDPDAGGLDTSQSYPSAATCQEDTNLSACRRTRLPEGSVLRLICPLGEPMSTVLWEPYYKPYGNDSVLNQAQVWKAELVVNRMVQDQKVALKLYDNRVRSPACISLHFMPGPLSMVSSCESPSPVDGRTLASNEAAAYQKLAHLQGSAIPQSYGTYEFKLPDGEMSCLGMVTEYVEHVNLSTHVYRILRYRSVEGVEAVKVLARACNRALRKILESKVIPHYVNATSLKYDPVSGRFTFVGFSSSAPELEPETWCEAYTPFCQAVRGATATDSQIRRDINQAVLDIFEETC